MSAGRGWPVGHSTNGSDGEARTIMAARCGGCWTAASHWIAPLYEPPSVPTLPVDHYFYFGGGRGPRGRGGVAGRRRLLTKSRAGKRGRQEQDKAQDDAHGFSSDELSLSLTASRPESFPALA